MNKIELAIEKISKNKVFQKGQSFIGSRSGVMFVSWVSFLESAFPLPILTDPFLIAAILANKKNTYKLIFVTTLWSVIGGIFAYFMAFYFFEWLLMISNSEALAEFQTMIDANTSNTFVLTTIGTMTPVPYTISAWAVAVLKGNFLIFVTASVLGRGLRYLVVGYTTYKFGSVALKYTRRYLNWLTALTFVLLLFYLCYKM